MGDSETDAGGRLDERADEARRVESEPRLWRRLRRLPRNVFSISLVSLFNDASSEIIYPVLPLFLALTLGATRAQIGLIEGAAESLSGFLKLFSGYFSDRRGRRKGMGVFGYGVASIARPLIGLATAWPQVFAIRMADRFGKGVRSAPRDAMIADPAPPRPPRITRLSSCSRQSPRSSRCSSPSSPCARRDTPRARTATRPAPTL